MSFHRVLSSRRPRLFLIEFLFVKSVSNFSIGFHKILFEFPKALFILIEFLLLLIVFFVFILIGFQFTNIANTMLTCMKFKNTARGWGGGVSGAAPSPTSCTHNAPKTRFHENEWDSYNT